MYAPIVRVVETIVSGIHKLASLKDCLEKSERKKLCKSLYNIYVRTEKILTSSKNIVSRFEQIESFNDVQDVHEMSLKLAMELSNFSKDLWELNHYLELVTPKLYWDFYLAFGYKLVLLDIMRKYYEAVTKNKDNKVLKIFQSIDFDRLTDTNYEELEYYDFDRNLRYIASMRNAGLIEIMELVPSKSNAKSFIVKQGRRNICMLEVLKDNLRNFLVSNFNMEELFFPRKRFPFFRKR